MVIFGVQMPRTHIANPRICNKTVKNCPALYTVFHKANVVLLTIKWEIVVQSRWCLASTGLFLI